MQTKRHPISRKAEHTPKKSKGKSSKKAKEKKTEDGSSDESSDDSDDDRFGGSTEEDCSDDEKQGSDDADSKQKIDMYLKDVSKKKDSSKKNGPPSFQAAFENLVASRSGALALRPGSVVEEMPPRKNKPKKRKQKGCLFRPQTSNRREVR